MIHKIYFHTNPFHYPCLFEISVDINCMLRHKICDRIQGNQFIFNNSYYLCNHVYFRNINA